MPSNNNNRGDDVILPPRYDLTTSDTKEMVAREEEKTNITVRTRPSKFTERNKQRILIYRSIIVDPVAAAKSAGVDPRTLKNWLAKGESLANITEDPDTLEPLERELYDFYIEFHRQPTLREKEQMSNLLKIAGGYPDEEGKPTRDYNLAATTWFLEHMYPDKYGARKNVRIGGGIDIDVREERTQKITIDL